jgi:hypothetical protein
MAEPDPNTRLAERLLSIGAALRDGGNGHAGGVATSLSDELIGALAKAIGSSVKTIVATALAPLVARIAELEQQLAECLKDGGTWNAEKLFRPGEVVSYRGVPWVCQKPNTNVRPGRSDEWRLMAKSQGHRWGSTPEM